MISFRKIIVAVCITLLIFVTISSAQDESFKTNVRKHIIEAEREALLRTPQENKLEGVLYTLLKSSERADTSAEAKAKFSLIMRDDKRLHVDSLGRIRIVVYLWTLGAADSVSSLIESQDGVVEHVGLVPYMIGRISPRRLRNLISCELIQRIGEENPGHTRSVK